MNEDITHTNESPLDQIIADFLEAEEAGRAPSREELIETHPEYADELRRFLASHDRFNALFDDDDSPQRIRYFGDYELVDEIARGGMGIVYKARQKSLNRTVAVKMILSEPLSTDNDLQRFREEARAAANLQHSGIVSVHEVGMHRGMHYFSMDYVEGKSLAEVARDAPLSPQRAAGYVRQIAEAVDFAHQEGILHRDLKPSNVLIDRNDRVQITDFGLALQVEGDSDLTRTGQVLGTPSYMPPEQAQHKRGLIGPTSDIYAIGSVLYELLTARPPFRADSAVKTLKQVVETEPPAPRLLNPEVPKDLETICLKCLEKEPHKRYATARHLADDLDRYLHGKPIVARPIGTLARTWRWCRRKPAVASLSASVILLLAATALISSLSAMRLEEQRDRAVAAEQLAKRRLTRAREAETNAQSQAKLATLEAKRANAVIELLQDMLGSAHPDASRGIDYTVRELLDDFSDKLDDQLQEQPEVEAALRQIIGSVYTRLSLPEKAEPHLKRALELHQQISGPEHSDTASSFYQLAWNRSEMGQHKVSEKLARQALSLYRDQADTAGILKALWLIQMCYHRRGESVPAERIGREALRIARDHDLLDNPTLPNIQHLLAWNKISQAKYAEAEGFARRALKGHLRVHGSEHPETAFCRRVVARALREQGQYSEAEQHARNALTIFRKHFPDDNREVLKSVRQLIGLLSVQGKWEAMANLDKNYPDSAALYFVRAQTYAKRRRLYGEAIKDYQRAIELDPKNRQLKQLSGDLYARRGCWQEAVNHYQSTTTADGINALYTYACLLILTNRENQYRSLCMQMIDQPLNTRNVMALRRRVQIGALHPASPIDPDRLVEWAEKAISIRRNRFTISALAWAKYRSARFEETIALLKEGIDNQNIHKSSVAFLLALTFHQLGDHQKSRTWYRFGCRVLELASPQTPEDVAAWALQHWLFVNVWYREARAELESTTPLTAPKPRFDRPLVAPRTTAQSR